MLGISLAWLAGTLLLHALPALPSGAWCVPLGLVAVLAAQHRKSRSIAFAVVAFLYTAWAASERIDARLPLAALNDDFAVTGWIDSFPSYTPGQVTFSFAVDEPRPPQVPPRLRLTWYDAPEGLVPGAALDIVARLRPPRGTHNPGGFDYERWLLVSDYGATGYVRSGAVQANAPPRGWQQSWLRFRYALAERIAGAAHDADAAALLTALAVGERYRFTETHWDDFRRTGTSHLVAVSGMHVALLGVCAFFVLRMLWLGLPAALARYDLEAAALASAAATVYYAALTGFAVPAQRSLLMVLVALAVLVSRRRIAPLVGLAAASWLVLLWDPFAPLTASFWLSFGAVAVLFVMTAPQRCRSAEAGSEARARLRSAANLLWQYLRVQWVIGFALIPLTTAFFGEISLVGPLVNLVAIPLFNLLLVPGTLIGTVLASFEPLASAAVALLGMVGVLASATVAALHAIAALPSAAFVMPGAAAWVPWLAALGVLLALGAWPLHARRLGWLALLPLFVPYQARLAPGAARLVVLDVGHGLAVIVETRAHRLLFDAGPSFQSGFDTGSEVVLPALAHRSHLALDRLLVSHADNDHSGGAAAVAAAFPEAQLLHGPDFTALGGDACRAGDRWEWDGVTFSVLHPAAGYAARGNDGSCVLKIATAAGAVLITGDIEARAERSLRDADVSAAVVVVPHHGSATSSSDAFVTAVDAEIALVSAGYANRWGFPRADVRARWERSGAELIVTGDSGAITVTLDARGIAVRSERDRRHHYWESPGPAAARSLPALTAERAARPNSW